MKTIIFFVLVFVSMSCAPPIRADDPAVPAGGFPASRYETLWTKSPFAVATAEAAADSPDYSLVGIANVEGVSYASVIEIRNQEHFLISSDKPSRGLTLTAITRSQDGKDTFATVQKDGQVLTLKLEQAPNAVPGAPVANVFSPGNMTPQLPMPGAGPSFLNGQMPRFPVRIHHPLIRLPPHPDLPQPTPPPPPTPSQ